MTPCLTALDPRNIFSLSRSSCCLGSSPWPEGVWLLVTAGTERCCVKECRRRSIGLLGPLGKVFLFFLFFSFVVSVFTLWCWRIRPIRGGGGAPFPQTVACVSTLGYSATLIVIVEFFWKLSRNAEFSNYVYKKHFVIRSSHPHPCWEAPPIGQLPGLLLLKRSRW